MADLSQIKTKGVREILFQTSSFPPLIQKGVDLVAETQRIWSEIKEEEDDKEKRMSLLANDTDYQEACQKLLALIQQGLEEGASLFGYVDRNSGEKSPCFVSKILYLYGLTEVIFVDEKADEDGKTFLVQLSKGVPHIWTKSE